MGRWGGYGRRTVEQTCSLDINELRRSGYIGKPPGNWWVARNNLFQRGFAPRYWNDDAGGYGRFRPSPRAAVLLTGAMPFRRNQ
jgi:hypothetical protein